MKPAAVLLLFLALHVEAAVTLGDGNYDNLFTSFPRKKAGRCG